jgi:hypothetical protein
LRDGVVGDEELGQGLRAAHAAHRCDRAPRSDGADVEAAGVELATGSEKLTLAP